MVTAETPGPYSVGELALRFKAIGADALSRELGTWVLVGPPIIEQENEWSFRTLSAKTVRYSVNDVEAMLDETFLVFPLQKPRSRTFASTLLVGRSRSNDVAINHSSVSKLHARIRLGTPPEMFLSDAGSSNGTHIDGTQLGAGEEKRLTHGALVRFGSWALQAIETARFIALLERLE